MDEFNEALAQAGEYGEVVQVKHPVVLMAGLPTVRIHEMVVFENGALGEIIAIYRNEVQVSVFSNEPLRTKMRASPLKKTLTIRVGPKLIGQTIDPLGNPLSKLETFPKPKEEREMDILPKGISDRVKINRQLITGVSVIDLMIPLGKGQKELVIGDRKTGKTDFLLTVMDSQAKLGSVVIYAAVAKQQSSVKGIQEQLKAKGIMDKSIVVATVPQNSPSLIFLTPYAAMTIAEYFRDQGKDVLLVIDDLSTHAKFYREISLTARKFPGRDSFPGDIFYIHARLLERAGNFKTSFGDRSISVFPSAETIQGDFTAFIPTNLMSMTDGHIYFDSDIFHTRRHPAVNIYLSVTRVGRQAQPPLIRDISREMMIFFNKFERVEKLSHFGAELNEQVQAALKQGEYLNEFFRQNSGVRLPLEVQIVCFSLIWLGLVNRLENITVAKKELAEYLKLPKEKQVLELSKVLELPSLKELLEWVTKNKERILKVCKISGS